METITFSYATNDTTNHETVTITIENEKGLTATSICDSFTDFMRTLGFSIERLQEYYAE